MPLPPFGAVHPERLTLRPVMAADLPDLLRVNGDDETTRYLPYEAWRGPEDAAAWLARIAAAHADGSGHQLAVERREDGRVIGAIRLFRHNASAGSLVVGYVFAPDVRGRGYAREAVAAACDHAASALGIHRLHAEVDPANAPSCRLLDTLGFRLEGRLRDAWVKRGQRRDTLVYARLAADRRVEGAA